MMRDLIIASLKEAGLFEAFTKNPRFKAELHFGAVPVVLEKKTQDVTLSGESPEGPISIKFCLNRNWLPLSFCLGTDTMKCDKDDLWERSDLGFVLGNDSSWENHLRILGFSKAVETK